MRVKPCPFRFRHDEHSKHPTLTPLLGAQGCCEALAELAAVLDTATAETKVYSLFHELAQDDDAGVRRCCLEHAAAVGVREPPLPCSPKIAMVCLPLIRSCIDGHWSGKGDPETTQLFVTIVGRALYGLRCSLSDHDVQEACTACHTLYSANFQSPQIQVSCSSSSLEFVFL